MGSGFFCKYFVKGEKMKRLSFLYACLFLLIPCQAEIITVDDDGPADFASIQQAVYYSWHGDIIIVNPGFYPEDISFGGRAITLTSLDPFDPNIVNDTVINGTVFFEWAEQSDSILQGFTILSQYSLPVCDNSSYQSAPAIYGDIVVWQDYRNSSYPDIYGKDLSTGEEFPICTESGSQYSPAIYGDIVVWIDNPSYSYYINGKDLSTGQEFSICTDTSYNTSPAIHGDIVVWQDSRNDNWGIYGKDLSTNHIFSIYTEEISRASPAIYGDIVVWQDYRNVYPDIYGKDFSTGIEFPICANSEDQAYPDIYEDIVVWQDYRNGNYDIYGKDLSTNEEFPICTESSDQYYPAIHGNIVVWHDTRNGSYDIYAKDISTGEEFAVCTEDGEQEYADIHDGVIVWQDNRSGNNDIYYTGEQGIIRGGIFCSNANPGIMNNVVTGYINFGIYGTGDSAPTVVGNTVRFGNHGISGCNGEIEENTFYKNSGKAISNCTNVTNNVIAENGVGVAECINVINNTIVAGANNGVADCNNVKNNIIAFNEGYGIFSPCDNNFNCFWENSTGAFGNGAVTGLGNFVTDPRFADIEANDYHLKSEAGRWDPDSAAWVLDDITSHCIDSGDPADDIGTEPNPNGGRINVGAYGRTAQASKSISGIIEPVCLTPPAMDFTEDCKVNLADFIIFASEWLNCGIDPQEACWE
jgi:beta propeller repeat protein